MTELPKWAMDKAAAVHQQMAEAAALKELKLSDNQAECVLAWSDIESDGDVLSFAVIASRTSLPSHLVRRTVRALARKGVTQYYQASYSEDGEFMGAGYGLTSLGRAVLEQSIRNGGDA